MHPLYPQLRSQGGSQSACIATPLGPSRENSPAPVHETGTQLQWNRGVQHIAKNNNHKKVSDHFFFRF